MWIPSDKVDKRHLRRLMDTSKIIPIFMCCARSDELLECTFNSYVEYLYHRFATPIIYFNSSENEDENERFRRKIKELFGDLPYILHHNKIPHVYKAVQGASKSCLQHALTYARKKGAWWNYLLFRKPVKYDGIMFCEDDITFSNLMYEAIAKFPLTSKTGFVTMYQPENGYRLHSENEIDVPVFYGTQCLVFPLDSLKKLCYNMIESEEGYDRVWAKTLAGLGLKLYALDASYVQHNQTSSLLSGHSRTHCSGVFKFDLENL